MSRKKPKKSSRPINNRGVPPRAEGLVFSDLENLARQPGFIHSLAALAFKSNVLLSAGTFTAEDFAPVYDKDRLLRTEVNLLTGLLLKGPVDASWPGSKAVFDNIENTLRLMEELHQAILQPAHEEFSRSLAAFKEGKAADSPLGKGMFLREAVFYGPESAFPFQYIEFAKKRYAPDSQWLKENLGFDISEAATVLETVRDVTIQRALDFANEMRLKPIEKQVETSFLNAFTFSPAEIAERTGNSVDHVETILKAFTYPAGDTNSEFKQASDFNKANINPIFSLEDGTLVALLEYSLSEALYENPFFWIAADKTYLGVHSQSRGRFTEDFTRERLQSIFDQHFLINNVVFIGPDGNAIAEADSLLFYGRRAYVIQAKSKRLTLASRAGNDEAIARDFQIAVQEAYDQALKVIEALQSGAVPTTEGRRVSLPSKANISEYYPICITSEHYPALSVQSREMLKTREVANSMPPLIFDVFALDVFAEFLTTPLFFADYLRKRSETRDQVIATHELVVLAYHLRKNLHVGEFDMISLDDSVMVDLDLAMAVRRTGLSGPATPRGILQRFEGTELQSIFDAVNSSPNPDVHRLGELLLGMDAKAEDTLCRYVSRIRQQTRLDGGIHDISLGFQDAGITVHCNRLSDAKARQRLLSHITMRKYAQRFDSWYGVTIDERGEPRMMVGLEDKWKPDSRLESLVGDFKVSNVKRSLAPRSERKIGRNERCPCGSGRKYKHCHGG